MRFDLLDEYSTLFRLGVSRNVASQDTAVPAKAAKRGTIANFASHLQLLRKLLGALRLRLSALRSLRFRDSLPRGERGILGRRGA